MSLSAGRKLPVQDCRIAIVAPTGRDAYVIGKTLWSQNVQAEIVVPEALISAIPEGNYAGAILTEEALNRFDRRALEDALDGQPAWSDFPIVLLTFKGAPPAAGSAAIERLGHVSLLERPLHATALLSAARGILRARARQREMEEFLQQRKHARDNLEALTNLRELFEKAPGCIAVTIGPKHRFEMANEAFRQLVQRKIQGRTAISALPEFAEQGLVRMLDRIYKRGESVAYDEKPLRLVLPSGEVEERFFAFACQPLIDSHGKVKGVFGEGFDVTNRKVAQERAQLLQSELIHLSRHSAMDAMASTLAHELNQPLLAITNYLQASTRLLERGDADALCNVDHALRQAAQAALRAGDIVRRARDMVTGSNLHRDQVELELLAHEAIGLATTGRALSRLVCKTRFEKNIFVIVDPVQIQQVILNIIRNALEAMEGLEQQKLEISTCTTGGMAKVFITDNGHGLKPDVRAQLFTPFISSKTGGLGVGLSISRTIVESHGGTIGAHSGDQGGTVVWFTLPLTSGQPV